MHYVLGCPDVIASNYAPDANVMYESVLATILTQFNSTNDLFRALIDLGLVDEAQAYAMQLYEAKCIQQAPQPPLPQPLPPAPPRNISTLPSPSAAPLATVTDPGVSWMVRLPVTTLLILCAFGIGRTCSARGGRFLDNRRRITLRVSARDGRRPTRAAIETVAGLNILGQKGGNLRGSRTININGMALEGRVGRSRVTCDTSCCQSADSVDSPHAFHRKSELGVPRSPREHAPGALWVRGHSDSTSLPGNRASEDTRHACHPADAPAGTSCSSWRACLSSQV
jgi:hypothetical protein